MAVAWIVAAGLTVALTTTAKEVADDGLADWDRTHLLHVRDGTSWAGFWKLKFTDGIILESPGNLFILIPTTLLAAGWAAWRGRVVVAIAVPLCYVAARGLIFLGWGLWDRSRPDLIEGGAAALAAHSFPSGHVILSLTTYGLVAWLWMRASGSYVERVLIGLLLLAFAAVVGLARLRLARTGRATCWRAASSA